MARLRERQQGSPAATERKGIWRAGRPEIGGRVEVREQEEERRKGKRQVAAEGAGDGVGRSWRQRGLGRGVDGDGADEAGRGGARRGGAAAGRRGLVGRLQSRRKGGVRGFHPNGVGNWGCGRGGV